MEEFSFKSQIDKFKIRHDQVLRLFWMRRDLRFEDNNGLHKALNGDRSVLPIFIFDRNILEELPRDDARVHFIYDQVSSLKKKLQNLGSDLLCFYGDPENVFVHVRDKMNLSDVYCNEDYEPYALDRDRTIGDILGKKDIPLLCFKDHVLFARDEVLKKDGNPYTVFTPYKNRWMEELNKKDPLGSFPSEECLHNFASCTPQRMIDLEDLGFRASQLQIPPKEVPQSVIKSYTKNRDYPSIENGTSRLGIHLRFGTISIRKKARKARELNETFFTQLIWRDFYAQILYHFPQVVSEAFRPKYDLIEWRNNTEEYDLWREGKTGFPLVDAGMRQLNATGYMHNRVRMVTASFLTKHLLIDWRWGESYFAEKLLDFDLANNNGGWQWAAGCGTDAAPYFRIFNPTRQLEKFDKQLIYVKKWVPEYGSPEYPAPMVDHKMARERCLQTYKHALMQKN